MERKHPVFKDVTIGTGTWAWGDRLFWGFGQGYNRDDIHETYLTSLGAGITFFDTAETYAQGRSETFLGEFISTEGQAVDETAPIANSGVEPVIATKFMPFPWRLGRRSLRRALRGSLKRLGIPRIDLYQIHWPIPPVAIETWIEVMIELQQEGLISAIGVSNFNRTQVQRAYSTLTNAGMQLASNQVEYSLLNRKAERSGLLRQCQEIGASMIAYSPLSSGVLSGKYRPDNPPPGIRSRRYNAKYLGKIEPIISVLKQIGNDHAGKTPAQVALNWVICKGAIPIPGAKKPDQVIQNSGAVGWSLSEGEVAWLDEVSDQISEL